MESFSIQKPRIRNYINEWIFHELSEELNLVKLKYNFINLKLMARRWACMLLKKGLAII